ncbi:hypothetical protein I601_4038 [Nocardioides dokdonensis FR1436]|uniref:DUF305 domain-containing protein n=1 Tax=Nocardioides dokdonensis FR1436 TaxID=1300347 RepID=A0A1A9GQ45_9ACTN|nr:DUF305 domain-containing protein [Nocardioides dokdonensis]ANH40434.1 hypothetical protein I601_4038 [Nocardioides dokdonensis FR1436]
MHSADEPRRPFRLLLAIAAGLVVTATLAGCGSDDAEPDAGSSVRTAPDGSEFNDADVDFATEMIPHHAQAVEMVVMAQGRDLSPEVETLMADIRDAQVPEIQTMTGWLAAWDEPVPETGLDHANAGHPGDDDSQGSDDMGDSDMGDMGGSMMSEEQMQELRTAGDGDFEQMWLEMMTEHHEGAVEMAEQEIEDGLYPEAIDLAESVIESQNAEIETMQDLLG